MALQKKELTKLYYSIGEVAKMFDIPKSKIRFWEEKFTILKPTKNSKGERRFTAKNIEQLRIIHHLIVERRFTIDGAIQEIKNNRKNITLKNKMIDRLQEIKGFMENFQKELGEEE